MCVCACDIFHLIIFSLVSSFPQIFWTFKFKAIQNHSLNNLLYELISTKNISLIGKKTCYASNDEWDEKSMLFSQIIFQRVHT